MSFLTDLCLAIYPLKQSYNCLKKPRSAELQHWLIFWQVWVGLHLLDQVVKKVHPLYNWIPFSGIFISVYTLTRCGLILANYNPKVTYRTNKIFLKLSHQELDNFYKNLKIRYLPFIQNLIDTHYGSPI